MSLACSNVITATCTESPSAGAIQREVDGIRYKLVSADGLHFCPYKICD